MLTCEQILASDKHRAVLEAKNPALLKRLQEPHLYLRPRPLAERSVERFSVIAPLNGDVKAANDLIDGAQPPSYLSPYPYINALYEYYTRYMNGDMSYDGAYLKEMAKTGFMPPRTSNVLAAKTQFLRDILRGVKLDNRDLRNALNIDDPQLDNLLTRKPYDVQAIQDRMIALMHGYESTLAKSFLTDDKIRTLVTAEMLEDDSGGVTDLPGLKQKIAMHLLHGALEAEHVDDVLKIIFPALDDAQIMQIIQGHHQSMLTATQFLIDPEMLGGAGYSLNQPYNANIFIDPTDGSIRYRVSKDNIILRKQDDPGMGDEVRLDGSIAIEYILEKDGFALREIEISDPVLKKLVLAKTADEMKAAIEV